MAKKKQKLDEGMILISSLLPVGQVVGLSPKRKDNFQFKGLPGQFNENGEKVLDENGNRIKEEKINEDMNVNASKFYELAKILFEKSHPVSVVKVVEMAVSDLYNDKKINDSKVKRIADAVLLLHNTLKKI